MSPFAELYDELTKISEAQEKRAKEAASAMIPIHFHHCPECYQKWECQMKCTLEPDLEDEGKQFGSHCMCDGCEKEIVEQQKYFTKEFWLRYNGFIK